MTNTVMRALFFQKFAAFSVLAHNVGIDFIIFCFYRSPEEQKKRFEEKKSNCDGYKIKSAHQKWLAIDICIIKNGKLEWKHVKEYDTLGKLWEMLGGIWGGSWAWAVDDIYHIQFGDI